jgi:hypothetical protein
MRLSELLLYYQCERQKIATKDKKRSEHQFILNVHKAYQYYMKIDDNHDVSIETVLRNVDALILKFNEQLKPTSIRNYICWMRSSLTEAPLNDVLNVELKDGVLTKMNEALKGINKQVNDGQLENRVINDHVSSQEDVESVLDIDSIVPINEVVETCQVNKVEGLIEEINILKEEINQWKEEVTRLTFELRLEKEKDALRLDVCERLWRIVESKH